MTRVCYIFVVFLLFVQSANAKSCFIEAQSYYEQIYCEVKSRGKGQMLPTFIDFKRNNEMTQALLLKRDARSLRIDLKMPVKKGSAERGNNQKARPSSFSHRQSDSSDKDICELKSTRILCGGLSFVLTGNRKNQDLSPDALSEDNRLVLSDFSDDQNDEQAYGRYVTESYVRYLKGMHSIGLGGVTMPYGRFHFLFTDLESKGVNASARFATMFEYLKQDKARNSVSEDIATPASLTINDCSKLNEEFAVCNHSGRNFLYVNAAR